MAISDDDLKVINPRDPVGVASAQQVNVGVPIPKGARVRTFSPEEWEQFVEEWATTLESHYVKVRRFGGAGDFGVDVAGFESDAGFQGAWDNFQCKRYGHPLRPSDVWVEIGKVIYYSWCGEYSCPRRHYFVCSDDIGTRLEQLLNNSERLKEGARSNWDAHCRSAITSTGDIPLTDELESYFDKFDFAIFSSKSVLDLINAHAGSKYHAVRFGGGLPPRPTPDDPPETPEENESRYIRQLLDAYGDRDGVPYVDQSALLGSTQLQEHFLRQRERFYHAEALRNFARDTVPEGTFAALQEEIFEGVIDICGGGHANGFDRMRATLSQAAALSSIGNALQSAAKVQDRLGICHQLANGDRLIWVRTDG